MLFGEGLPDAFHTPSHTKPVARPRPVAPARGALGTSGHRHSAGPRGEVMDFKSQIPLAMGKKGCLFDLLG